MFRKGGGASVLSELTTSGVPVLTLEGEFDLANVAEARYALGCALTRSRGSVAVDLSRVTFLDAKMLHVLIAGLEQARANRGTLVLIRPHPNVWRAFEVVALDRSFRAYATRGAAIADLGAWAEAGATPVVGR
jgi:anti-anti-sigma factor